jgi:hypothetical protein
MLSTVQDRWILLRGKKTSGTSYVPVCIDAGDPVSGAQRRHFLR